MYLIFDTETTGLPRSWKATLTDTDNWPRCVQIAWQLHDEMGEIIEHKDFLIRLSNTFLIEAISSPHILDGMLKSLYLDLFGPSFEKTTAAATPSLPP